MTEEAQGKEGNPGALQFTEGPQWGDPVPIGKVGNFSITAREPLNDKALEGEARPRAGP